MILSHQYYFCFCVFLRMDMGYNCINVMLTNTMFF